MTGRFAVLSAVLRSPILRRLEAAYALFAFGEWATWVAVIVYAYGRGGAGEAGVVVFVELAPSVVLAPAVAAVGDRYPRARVLLGTYAIQAVLMAATALAIGLSTPALFVYLLATLTATAVSLSRPVHASLLPEVVASPDDLTAANVVTGMAESAGSLVGPLGAGLLIGLGGPAAVFAVTAAANLVGVMTVAAIARRAVRVAPSDERFAEVASPPLPGADPPPTPGQSRLAHLVGGVSAIWSDRRLRAVVVIATWATFLVGALDIFYAVLAIDLMGLDESGVGFVGALGGVGAIAGSAAGLVLVGRERLGVALAVSGLLFGAAIAAISVAPGAGLAAALLIVAGMGSGLTYVAAHTLIQRLAGDDVMSRVFGVLQGLMMGATALGALAVPVLIALAGERAAFAVAGLSLPIAIVLLGRAVVRGDRLDPGRVVELRLLRAIPMLSPLSAPVLERLAGGVVPSTHPPGSVVIREGDRGDRYYVVASGRLDVSVNGRHIRMLGPGDGFGEIALIRDVRRTATITAIDEASLLALDRGPFLEALTGQARSRTIATGLVDDRLGADAPVI